jgi:lipid-A-disaccharide synthase
MDAARARILVVAGDVSGDAHAAEVLGALGRSGVRVEAFGMGGDCLAAAGMRVDPHLREATVVGIAEALRMLPRLYGIYRRLLALMRRERPDLVLLVDYPDMNLRLARQARRLGLDVCYYVVPQVWAWRARRVRRLREDVGMCLCLFAFEEPFLRARGVREAHFVGHPMMDHESEPPGPAERARARQALGLGGEGPIVAVLPGSRRSELQHHLQPFLGACALMARKRPEARFLLPLAPGLTRTAVDAAALASGVVITVLPGGATEALLAADVALVKAGTSTVQAALCGTPMVVGYRLARSSYWLAKRLVRCPHIAMANLLAGERAFPELVQDELTAEALCREAERALESPPPREVYGRIRTALGGPGSAERAAERIRKRFFGAEEGPMKQLTLYGKADCSLCDKMKAVVERVAAQVPLELREVSIEGDPELQARYWKDIPVLLEGGRELFRHRVTEQALLSALRAEPPGQTFPGAGSRPEA